MVCFVALIALVVVFLLGIFAPIVLVVAVVGLVVGIVRLSYRIYEFAYFKSKRFSTIKENIKAYVEECNELNSHVEDLKKAYVDIKHTDYGNAVYTDDSVYNFKRPELEKVEYSHNTYQCSLSVCRNAQSQPFKYVCKYFNIVANEETLERFEKAFNAFSAAEQGKELLKAKKDEIMCGISKQIPFLIRKFTKREISKELGFMDVDLSDLYFPKYTFQYVSAGGNSSMSYDVIFDLDNLERFINYLSEKVKFRKSIAGQRALMTARLREKIKIRDNYTCKTCGISTVVEPHLLLEIDHIVPLSQNGITTEDNLQTLCWKCNRSKGAKILS